MYGTIDIANHLEVKPTTIHQWRQRHPDFPPPDGYINNGTMPYWRRLTAIDKWRNKR